MQYPTLHSHRRHRYCRRSAAPYYVRNVGFLVDRTVLEGSSQIELAYELLVDKFGYEASRLYATVYSGSTELNIPPDEEESMAAWARVGLSPDHIVPLGEDNFWGPARKYGPCGPCTEVFYDTGAEHGERYSPGKHFDADNRYIEIWNAGVFMEFDKQPTGLERLQLRSVDTGSGLERMLMNLNQVDSVYETDRLEPLVRIIGEQLRTGVPAAVDAKIIADHIRAISFMLADGVRPSNIGQGYIPRRLIRKCVSLATLRSVPKFAFAPVLDVVIDRMAQQHPRLASNRKEILQTFEQEQREFSDRLRLGLDRLAALCSRTPIYLSGADALSLVSTFGLPMEIIRKYVQEKGGSIDEEGFRKEYRRHQEVSRGGGRMNQCMTAWLGSLPNCLRG